MKRQLGMALAPWDAIEGGKFQSEKALRERQGRGEGSQRKMMGSDGQSEDEIRMSQALANIAAEHGIKSVTAIALAYVLSKVPYVFPLIGAAGSSICTIMSRRLVFGFRSSRFGSWKVLNCRMLDIRRICLVRSPGLRGMKAWRWHDFLPHSNQSSPQAVLNLRRLYSEFQHVKFYSPFEMNRPLSEAAEIFRIQIKKIIPRAVEDKSQPDDESQPIVFRKVGGGIKLYSGEELGILASRLVNEMKLGEGWGWNLAHFSEPKPIINNSKRMYLVPLSEGASLTPGGLLPEKSYTYITDQPTISSDTTVIFIAPV